MSYPHSFRDADRNISVAAMKTTTTTSHNKPFMDRDLLGPSRAPMLRAEAPAYSRRGTPSQPRDRYWVRDWSSSTAPLKYSVCSFRRCAGVTT